MIETVKVVVYVPTSDAEKVRRAAGEAGAGRIGNYSFCSFSSVGVGRFQPENGAHPAVGRVGRLEEVAEERIEFTCTKEVVAAVVEAIKAVHPYEEVALDVYPLYSANE